MDSTPDTFTAARVLLTSLLRFWPHSPQTAPVPAVLLCGPSGNGKSHLVHQCVADARASAADVIVATPVLSAAAIIRRRDGQTGLRQLLREAVAESVATATTGDEGRRRGVAVDAGSEKISREQGQEQLNSAKAGAGARTALIVLDRLELFIGAPGQSGEAGVGKSSSGDDYGRGQGSLEDNVDHGHHSALMVDLYNVLTAEPPLLDAAETAALQIGRLVVVGMFADDLDAVHPLFRNGSAFSATLSLLTPDQAAREHFFREAVGAVMPGGGSGAECLMRALAFRTGGVSYQGLTEVLDALQRATLQLQEAEENDTPGRKGEDDVLQMLRLLLSCRDASAFGATPTSNPTTEMSTAEKTHAVAADAVTAEEDFIPAVAATVAQRLVSRFQASGSMAATDYRSSAGYVDVQVTRWADVAGMADTKRTLQQVVTRPLRFMPFYRKAGVLPSTGILLYGPPGTGKTMLAKAIATELNASFLYLDLPSLVQCEVGESERKLKQFFATARERSPTVMFVDEMQAAFGIRYSDADHGAPPSSAHDARLVSHLLQLLDEAQADDTHVVVFIGATNVVHMLDPLILRAGRLDTHIAVGLPGADARAHLVRRVVYGSWSTWVGSTGDRALQEALVTAFVERSEGCSGAELKQATSVFALRLLQQLTRDEEDSTAGEVDETRTALERARLEDLHSSPSWTNVIAQFLWDRGAEALRSEAVQLVDAAFKRQDL